MRRLLFVYVLLVAVGCSYATKRALIIGIGDYPQESGWTKINGDKDIPIVQDILAANGFKSTDMQVLKNNAATKAAIASAFAQLAKDSRRGDVVYIHFSGHGQQVTDQDRDEGDGLDEAWVPYDAVAYAQKGRYNGENHILDDELYEWCLAIRQKIGDEGNLIVIADACHSGDGEKGVDGDEDAVRGSILPDLDVSIVFQKIGEKITSVFKPKPSPKQPRVVDWTFVSACQALQENQEYQKTGSLTAALYSLKDQLSSLNYAELRFALKRWMATHLNRTQTPTVEGPESGRRQTLL